MEKLWSDRRRGARRVTSLPVEEDVVVPRVPRRTPGGEGPAESVMGRRAAPISSGAPGGGRRELGGRRRSRARSAWRDAAVLLLARPKFPARSAGRVHSLRLCKPSAMRGRGSGAEVGQDYENGHSRKAPRARAGPVGRPGGTQLARALRRGLPGGVSAPEPRFGRAASRSGGEASRSGRAWRRSRGESPPRAELGGRGRSGLTARRTSVASCWRRVAARRRAHRFEERRSGVALLLDVAIGVVAFNQPA